MKCSMESFNDIVVKNGNWSSSMASYYHCSATDLRIPTASTDMFRWNDPARTPSYEFINESQGKLTAVLFFVYGVTRLDPQSAR